LTGEAKAISLMAMNTSFRTLDVPGGTIAFEVAGTGPSVVCLPGMGDLRSSYRALAPELVAAGYRVAVADLRGHGDSSAAFGSYGDEETAADTAALIEHLGEASVIVGNSMGAGAAVILAADRPELVRGLVLIGPFVRDPASTAIVRVAMRVALAAPWIGAVWRAYLPSLFAGRKPEDFAAHRDAITAALRRPGHAAAFSRTARLSHDGAERALPRVFTSTLVVMGELDPDFPDPALEAAWIAERLGADTVMVPEAGHYPHSQRPDLVSSAVVNFLREGAKRG
jgi:pimeloyl-ACP methyl ester carboxylesterase